MSALIENVPARASEAKVTRGLSADMAINVVFAVFTTLGVVWLTRLSTASLAPVALAVFLGVRRYSASVSALANLGGPYFQIRYMGIHHDQRELGELISLFVTGVFLAASVVLCLGLLPLRHVLSRTFSEARGYPSWFAWFVVLMALQQLLHFSVQNYFLVKRRLFIYNAYKFLAATGLFLPVFLLLPNVSAKTALQSYLVSAAVLLTLGHLFVTVRPLLQWRQLPWRRLGWIAREAATYGPPRALINFLDSLLFVLPIWLIRDDVVETAFLLTIFVFVQATGIVILPINEVAMVATAANVGAGDEETLSKTARTMFGLLLVLSAAVVASIYPFRYALFHLGIGSEQVIAGVAGYSLLLTCIVPATVFGGLKGIIDIRWRAPKNLLNLCISQGLAIFVFFLMRHLQWTSRASVTASCLAGLWTLGVFTLITLRPLLSRIDLKAILVSLCVVAGGALVAELLARMVSERSVPIQLVCMATTCCLTAAAAIRTVDRDVWTMGVDRMSRLFGQRLSGQR